MTLDPNSLAIEDRAFLDRACRYLEGDICEDQFARLQEELRGNRDRQELLMQLSTQEVLLVQCGEGMVAEGTARQTWQVDRRRLRIAALVAVAAAVALAVGASLANAGFGTRQLRLEQVAAATFVSAPADADEFTTIRLSDGVAAFSLENGIRLVASDRCHAVSRRDGTIDLRHGTLAIEVPDGADGIRVETPHAAFRDVGTHFVVHATPRSTELHVLEGKVAVLPGHAHNLDQAVTVVSHSQALRIRDLADPGGMIHTKFDPRRFALEVPTEIPIPVVNTGLQHRVGDADGYWAIVELPTDIGTNMQRAAVVTLTPYEPNDPAKSQWISVAHPLPQQPGNAKYQFRTGFELNGCKPETARLTGRFWVDNFVTAIRLNGVEQPVPDQRSSGLNHHPGAATNFVITSGFRHGFNLLEFDVINSFSEGGPNATNPMAFRCEMAGNVKVALDPETAAAGNPDDQPLLQQ